MKARQHQSCVSRPGFSLMEAGVLVAGLGLAASLLLPTLGGMRTDARLAGSRDNLRQLGEAHAAYSAANSGFIAGYDWVGNPGSGGFGGGPPSPEYDMGCGVEREAEDNLEAAQLQFAAILRKLTARCGTENQILPNLDRLPHHRFGHLPLLDWLGTSATDPLIVSPLDVHQQDFQSITRVEEYPSLPGGGSPDFTQAPGNWGVEQTVVQWTYASSYLTAFYAFSPSRPLDNHRLAIEPASDGTLFTLRDPQALNRQLRSAVRFPSNKALLFEEFDYSQGLGNQGRYYADPLASVNVLAFDGSAPLIATADANPGWDPDNFTDMERSAELRYASIDTRYFPDDSERPDAYGGYSKWTRGGLEGIDFGAGEINTSEW